MGNECKFCGGESPAICTGCHKDIVEIESKEAVRKHKEKVRWLIEIKQKMLDKINLDLSDETPPFHDMGTREYKKGCKMAIEMEIKDLEKLLKEKKNEKN